MRVSLRDKLLVLDDSTLVLPGHGPTTTVGRERASNPFLQDLGPGADQAQAPARRSGL
jgi:glyoxylase-like metal-dependent hydrolase (beta-lactamase superfamily II)